MTKSASALPKLINPPGYTLIELLVVLALTIILMLSASTLFITNLLNSSKVVTSQKVKSEGQQALSQMIFLIRNAKKLDTTCGNNLSTIDLENLDGQITTLHTVTDQNVAKIASSSTAANGQARHFFLTYTDSIITNLTFSCVTGVEADYITVSFNLKKNNQANSQVSVSQNFSQGVLIRNSVH